MTFLIIQFAIARQVFLTVKKISLLFIAVNCCHHCRIMFRYATCRAFKIHCCLYPVYMKKVHK
jgi:hypothetical protein